MPFDTHQHLPPPSRPARRRSANEGRQGRDGYTCHMFVLIFVFMVAMWTDEIKGMAMLGYNVVFPKMEERQEWHLARMSELGILIASSLVAGSSLITRFFEEDEADGG